MDLSLTDEQRAFAEEARSWLEEHLELPDLPFASMDAEVEWGRAWQRELAAGRWVGLHWPREYGGRGASPIEVAIFNLEYARSRAPQPVNRVGLNHGGPTVLIHGTEDQKQRWLPPILSADEIWCQLYSEPDAGSDLASLSTRAERVDGGWLVSGQKVWTSYAQYATWGLALIRTSTEGRKHEGITCCAIRMDAPGVTIRPLVQITGEEEFSETFLDEVFVPDEDVIGTVNDGWRVATTTLAHERGVNFPFKEQVVHEVYFDEIFRRAVDDGHLDDVLVAEDLAASYVELRLLALSNLRTMSKLADGEDPGPESSLVKLQWTDLTKHLSDLAAELFPDDPRWVKQRLWSKASSIAGGTSEIQKDIVGDRLLGLPRAR